jgi:hypothetical protein
MERERLYAPVKADTSYMTRLTPASIQALLRHRFYADLMALQSAEAPAVDVRASADAVRRLDVGWVVVWPDGNRRVLPFLEQTGFRRVREEDGILLYRRDAAGP